MLSNLFKYSFKNTLRNKFLTISSILVLTLLMFFINVLGVLEDVSNKIISSVNSKMSIVLYLKNEYNDKSLEVKDLIGDINKLNLGVKVKYFSRNQILKDIGEKDEKLKNIVYDLDKLEENNLLPKTIIISNINISDYGLINNLIERKMYILANNETGKKGFANYSNQYDRIKTIIDNLNLLKMGLYIIISIFFIAIAIISYSVISNFVYYYRDEIYITKLVGGSNIFIYGPFVLQGILYAVISFLLNFIIFIILIKNFEVFFLSYLEGYSFSISTTILIAEFIIFVIIGAVSGYFSSKKYLKNSIT